MSIFPEPIRSLPEADIPLQGVKAYLSQCDTHQIIFMDFREEAALPEHAHAAQWGVVLAGKIDLVINGRKETYRKGDNYFIPEGVVHSGRIYPGYADMTYFAQAARYKRKEP